MGRKLKIRTCGIYDVLNTKNDKHYVGHSCHIERRLRQHRNELRRKIHANPHLQHAWDFYGEDAFEFKIIEVCDKDKDVLCKREAHWMRAYDSIQHGYNIWDAEVSTLGFKHSEETIKQLRAISKWKKVVIQFDLIGKVIRLFASAAAAERGTGVSSEHIRECCNGKNVSAGGFLWAYEDEYVANGVAMKRQLERRKPKCRKSVIQLDRDFNKIITHQHLSAAAKSVGTEHCAIRQVCLGNTFFVKGYRWMYEDEYNDQQKLEDYKQRVAGKGRYEMPV